MACFGHTAGEPTDFVVAALDIAAVVVVEVVAGMAPSEAAHTA